METKLELKHPSAYLPYKLKFISSMDKPFDEYGLQPRWTLDGISILFGDYCFLTKEVNDAYAIQTCKLILRPLSDLTKEIEVNGERFIPLFNICKLQGFSIGKVSDWKFTFNTEFNKTAMMNNGDWIFRYLDREKSFWLNGIAEFNRKHQKSNKQLQCFEKLFEWHFDVFGLIEAGLAIDINTLDR